MIVRSRRFLIDAVGALFALVSLTLAGVAVTFLAIAFYGALTGGALLRPTGLGAAGFVLALVTRFLADLDQYEFVPPSTTTRGAGTHRRPTRRTRTP